MRIYNERSGVEYDAYFEAQPGTPTVPGTVHWRLLCATNEQTLVDCTPVPYVIESDESGITGVRARIDVPGSKNVIVNPANRREIKELQVVCDKDTDREFSEVMQYYVARMIGR